MYPAMVIRFSTLYCAVVLVLSLLIIAVAVQSDIQHHASSSLLLTIPTHFPTVSPTSCQSFSSSELEALKDLHNSTNGAQWEYRIDESNSQPWNFTQTNPNPCAENWAYIHCDRCSVSEILIEYGNLNGTIPSSIQQLPSLQEFQISYNPNLVGTIPDSICALSYLSLMFFSHTGLHGTIPQCIGRLKYLEQFNVYMNFLSGTLPSALGDLPLLVRIDVFGNNFSGPIPESLGNLTLLGTLRMDYNHFTGTLPASLGKCFFLTNFEIFSNHISGTIPNAYENWQSIRSIEFGKNHLSGTIPPWIEFLVLNLNNFTGSLPSTLNTISGLKSLDFDTNSFTGQLPAFTGSTHSLTQFFVNNNLFTGPLPSNFGQMRQMGLFYAYNNLLTGTLPRLFDGDHNIAILQLQNNMFSGTISEAFGNLTKLESFRLNDNIFTGTLPQTLERLTALQDLFLHNNHFTGTIGDIALRWDNLGVLYADDNFFTGPISTSLEHKDKLQVILLDNNMLTGTIPDGIATRALQCLDVSSNSLTGSVPSSLFTNTSLETLVLAKNCLTWTMTEDVCQLSGTLKSLILDSIHSDSSCQERFFQRLPMIKTYRSEQVVFGSLPPCLFTDFSHLQSLHLSSNSMTGSLPENITSIPESLKNLTLSHNFLTGTIPLAIQFHNWTSLDLSFNQLQGTLDDDFVYANERASLYLKINQLSGEVPRSFRDAQDISVLTGNLFTCGLNRESLPVHDEDYNGFQCGSDSVNNALYSWLLLLGILSLGVLGMWLWRRSSSSSTTDSTAEGENNQVDHEEETVNCDKEAIIRKDEEKTFIQSLISYDAAFAKAAADTPCHGLMALSQLLYCVGVFVRRVSMVMLLLCLSLYLILSKYFATVSPSYAWEASVVNKAGQTPAVLMLLMLTLVLAMAWTFQHSLSVLAKESIESPLQHLSLDSWINHSRYLRLFVFDGSLSSMITLTLSVVVNVIIVIAVTVSYVRATSPTNTDYTASQKQLISIGASLFKIVWNGVVISIMVRYLTVTPSDSNLSSSTATGDVNVQNSNKQLKIRTSFMLLLFFNNIIAPCLAIVLYSEDCLYFAFVPAPDIVSSYTYFSYTIELINLLLVPIGIHVSAVIYSTSPFQYRFRCTSTLLMVFADVFIYRYIIISLVLPCLLLAVKAVQRWVYDRNGQRREHWLYRLCERVLPAAWQLNEWSRVEDVESVFQGDKFVLSLLSDLSVLLVFGSVFPLVAVVGLVYILLNVLQVRVLVGRVLLLAEEIDKRCQSQPASDTVVGSASSMSEKVRKVLNRECSNMLEKFSRLFERLLWVVPSVWSAFLFDVLGGEVGADGAVWILIVMGLGVPCLGWLIELFIRSRRQPVLGESTSTEEDSESANQTESFGMSVMRPDESRRNSSRPVSMKSMRSSSISRRDTTDSRIMELSDHSSKRLSKPQVPTN